MAAFIFSYIEGDVVLANLDETGVSRFVIICQPAIVIISMVTEVGMPTDLQRGAAYHSLGFEDKNLGSSPGWWAATVATYCPSRPGNYPNSYLQNLGIDRPPRYVCKELF